MGYLISLGIVGLLLLAAAVVAAWWLWRKGRTGRAFVVALAALGVWQVYTAVYPSDSFYKAEFEKVTGTKFPPDAQIMFKRASFPDLFGDYTSCALINVATQEYERL